MKRTMSTLLALGMIAALLSIFVGSASAETDGPMGQITVVNGLDAVVNVTTIDANGDVDLGTNLALGDEGIPAILVPGTYVITFADADAGNDSVASYELTLGAVEAWVVVSGYADPTDQNANNAMPYEIDLEEATPFVTVANSSAVAVTVDPGGDLPQGEDRDQSDEPTFVITPPTGVPVDIDLSGEPATSYNFVVVVGTDDALDSATLTIPDLAALKTELEGTTPPGDVAVPDVTEKTEADANTAITEAGLVPAKTEAASDTVAAGTVISQDPAPETMVAAGSTVNIVVSTGTDAPGEVPVPAVVGETEADATTAITDAGLVAATTEAASDTVEAGTVISQDPAPDTMVAQGSTVNIVVSTGVEAPAVVPVPDVVGQEAADARTTLEAAGFVVEITEEQSDTVETGLVISMNPSAGTEVAEGTTVVLAVSSGMGDIIVPDFSGMTIAEATTAAGDAGLTITFVEDSDRPDPEGIVVSQDPEEGTTAEAGSEVVAQLSPAFDDAWAILVVDANRELTVTGINFQPNTTTESSVLESTVFQTAAVGESGSWTTKIDISSLDSGEHFLSVTGTAEDGSDYAETFKIPEAGQSTDQPATTESGGFPWWGWAIIGLLVVAVIAIAVKVFGGSDDGDDGDQPTADSEQPTASS